MEAIAMRTLMVFILFLSFTLFTTPAFAADVPTLDENNFFVQDHADIFSDSNRDDLLEIGQSLQDESTAQVVVLTIDSLDGDPANSFAVKAFDHYGIGEGDVNNGTLIMFAEDDHEIQIITGKGIEKIISDERAGEILDEYAIPYFKEGQYDDGLTNTYKQIVADLADHYNVTVNADDTSVEPEAAEQGIADKGMGLIDKGKTYFTDHPIISIGAVIVVLFMLKGFLGGGRRRRRYNNYDDGYGYSNRRNRGYSRNRSSISRSSGSSSRRKTSGGGGSSSGGGSTGRKW